MYGSFLKATHVAFLSFSLLGLTTACGKANLGTGGKKTAKSDQQLAGQNLGDCYQLSGQSNMNNGYGYGGGKRRGINIGIGIQIGIDLFHHRNNGHMMNNHHDNGGYDNGYGGYDNGHDNGGNGYGGYDNGGKGQPGYDNGGYVPPTGNDGKGGTDVVVTPPTGNEPPPPPPTPTQQPTYDPNTPTQGKPCTVPGKGQTPTQNYPGQNPGQTNDDYYNPIDTGSNNPNQGYPGECGKGGKYCDDGGQGQWPGQTITGGGYDKGEIQACMQGARQHGYDTHGGWGVNVREIKSVSVLSNTQIDDYGNGRQVVVIKAVSILGSTHFNLMNPNAIYYIKGVAVLDKITVTSCRDDNVFYGNNVQVLSRDRLRVVDCH